jgi:hypothetical protein
MELIERYLQAVGFWLPNAQRKDILAELSEDIRSEIEAREKELGRAMTDDDYEALLKHRGSPHVVAHKFLPERYLIGPVLFPIYVFVLKMQGLFYVGPWLLTWLALVAFSPAYRSGHPVHALLELWTTTVFVLFFTTLGFVIADWLRLRGGDSEPWNPRRLPPLRSPDRIPRSSSLFELAGCLALLAWWATFIGFRTEYSLWDLRITLVPEWLYVSAAVLTVTSLTVALATANLFNPWWTRFRASLKLLLDGAGAAVFGFFLKISAVAQLATPKASPEQLRHLVNDINHGMALAFPFAVVVGVVVVAFDVRRIMRLQRPA